MPNPEYLLSKVSKAPVISKLDFTKVGYYQVPLYQNQNCILHYYNDILIYTQTFEEHTETLK